MVANFRISQNNIKSYARLETIPSNISIRTMLIVSVGLDLMCVKMIREWYLNQLDTQEP